MAISILIAADRLTSEVATGDTAAGRRREGRELLLKLISEGRLALFAETGSVKDHLIFPASEQEPPRILYEWTEEQEIWSPSAIVGILDEVDFRAGTLRSLPSDTNSAEFAYPWRGNTVVIEAEGLTVDEDELGLAIEELAIQSGTGAEVARNYHQDDDSKTGASTHDNMRTGLPGRPPKGAAIIEREYSRRCNAREALPETTQEAAYLVSWYKEKYPNADQPQATSVENKIRESHRAYRDDKKRDPQN